MRTGQRWLCRLGFAVADEGNDSGYYYAFRHGKPLGVFGSPEAAWAACEAVVNQSMPDQDR